MSRRIAPGRRIDAAVVGGGIVGAACALALAREGLQVTLIERAEPAPWSADAPDRRDPRVYAFAPDSAALLDAVGVWDAVVAARVQPYRRMCVWDAGGGEALRFDADALAVKQLGWIVENALLQDRLWAALRASTVTVRCPAAVVALERRDEGSGEAGATLELDDGLRIEARVAIAADGARSTLRDLAGIATTTEDYAQRGVVAYVATERPHEDTAWQRFLPTGPLAFLPCAPWADAPHVSSIVWTLAEAEAVRVLALDDARFAEELTRAFASRLGACRPLTPRIGFPLRRQLAEAYAAGPVLAMGDAAHVVHPLAGQGVNLGLRDASALRALVADARARRADWAAPHRLARWARARRSDATASAQSFSLINRVFSSNDVAATLLRGHALGLAGALPPLNRALWRHAAGV